MRAIETGNPVLVERGLRSLKVNGCHHDKIVIAEAERVLSNETPLFIAFPLKLEYNKQRICKEQILQTKHKESLLHHKI